MQWYDASSGLEAMRDNMALPMPPLAPVITMVPLAMVGFGSAAYTIEKEEGDVRRREPDEWARRLQVEQTI